MPRGDGTGPRGKGTMRGRGTGRRQGGGFNINMNQQPGFSLLDRLFSGINKRISGTGRGSGAGQRSGTGYAAGRAMNYPNNPAGYGTRGEEMLNKPFEDQDASQLRERARQIKDELEALQEKLEALENNKKYVKRVQVDQDLCMGCGRCESVCPVNAISVRDTAEIDQDLCTLCGRCVNECPVNALIIV